MQRIQRKSSNIQSDVFLVIQFVLASLRCSRFIDNMEISSACRSVGAISESVRIHAISPVSSVMLLGLLGGLVAGRVAPACISSSTIDDPFPAIRNIFAPPSVLHFAILSLSIVIQSVTIERSLGSARFFSVILGNLIIISLMITKVFPTLCFPGHESLGPLLVSTSVLLHGRNFRIFTDGMKASVRTPSPIEPRWHCWVLLALYTVGMDRDTLSVYLISFLVGLLPYLGRVVKWFLKSLGSRDATPGLLLLAGTTVLPFTVTSLGDLPFNGPTILQHRPGLVADVVSLLVFHFLLLWPIVLFATGNALKSVTVSLVGVATVYCMQSPLMEIPGPGLVAMWISALMV